MQTTCFTACKSASLGKQVHRDLMSIVINFQFSLNAEYDLSLSKCHLCTGYMQVILDKGKSL